MVRQIATLEEFNTLVSEGKVVMIDFTATWCGPCKMISPEFERLSGEYTDITFVKVDVDANSDAAAKCEISAMPTFQVWKDGAKKS
mmetsp:Transcript_989/g.797  ORF Transcript_989/g.797 Transcript_989/m.797 type:complete len:86 (+) Transcript_989:117-374(+)